MKPPLTGIGYYTLNLLKEFVEDTEINKIFCIHHTKLIDINDIDINELLNVRSTDSARIYLIIPKIRKILRKIPYIYKIREWLRNINFQSQIEKEELSDAVYIEPNYIIRKSNNKTIAVIHDLSHIHYPEYHPRERVQYLNKELSETIKKASHIITVSEFIRHEIIHILGVVPNRVTAVWNGVGKHFRPYGKNESISILSRYGLTYKSYILSVATLEPRKNIHGLINSFMKLKDDLQRQYPLVLAGTSGWENSELKKIIKDLAKQGKIYDVGYVPDDILPLLTSGASVFLYISHYEGFGLPVLEAMASAVPVITSKMSSMSEVTGDAAILVDQNDHDEVHNAIEMILDDENMAMKYSRIGLERSKEFSWRRTANEVLKIIKAVAD